MNNINTQFAPRYANDIKADTIFEKSNMKSRKNRKRFNKAKGLTSFGGKRFLGLTPKGNRVFVSYVINNDLTLTMTFTHKLNVLLKS